MRRDDIKRKLGDKPIQMKRSDILNARTGIRTKLGIQSQKSSTLMKKKMNLKIKADEIIQCDSFMQTVKTHFNARLIKLKTERTKLRQRILHGNAQLMATTKAIGWPIYEIPAFDQDVMMRRAGREESTCSNGRIDDDCRHQFLAVLSQFMNSKAIPRDLSGRPTSSAHSIEADVEVESYAMLCNKKRRLTKQTEEVMNEFDDSLFTRRIHFFQTSLQLRMGDIQLITMLQELKCLYNMEQKGRDLASKRCNYNIKGHKVCNILSRARILISTLTTQASSDSLISFQTLLSLKKIDSTRRRRNLIFGLRRKALF